MKGASDLDHRTGVMSVLRGFAFRAYVTPKAVRFTAQVKNKMKQLYV